MKNILLFLFVISIGYSQTRTTTFQLPQWSTGDTLKSGTANDSSVSNFSLNNLGSRIDKILSKNIDSTGNFRHIRGTGTGNLEITAGAGGSSIGRIILNDSLYGTYNWQTTGNLLVGGNFTLGGYMTLDSIYGNLLVRGGDMDVRYDGDPFTASIYLDASEDTISVNGLTRFAEAGFYINAGTATVGAGDSVQVTYGGFTSSGIVMLTYIGGNATRTKIPVVGYRRTNGFTIYADAAETVAYFVVRR